MFAASERCSPAIRPRGFRSAAETDEFGVRRAFVSINPTQNDRDTWDAMDAASDQVRQIFAAPAGAVDVMRNRDGLGTTHHEGRYAAHGNRAGDFGDDAERAVSPCGECLRCRPRAFAFSRLSQSDAFRSGAGTPHRRTSGCATAAACARSRLSMAVRRHARQLRELAAGRPRHISTWTRRSRFWWLGQAPKSGCSSMRPRRSRTSRSGSSSASIRAGDNSGVFVRFRDPRQPASGGYQ